MGAIVTALQVITGLITGFFILMHEPKSEGLGAIGSASVSFKGVRSSADDRLDRLTWFFAIIFLLCSALIGFNIV